METSWKRHERLEPASQIIWLPAEPRAVRPLVLHQRALAHGEQVLARWWSVAEASARRKQSLAHQKRVTSADALPSGRTHRCPRNAK
jgi:hypothetical protein